MQNPVGASLLAPTEGGTALDFCREAKTVVKIM